MLTIGITVTCFALLAILVSSVVAFTPSAQQQADKALGRFDASTYLSVSLGSQDAATLLRSSAGLGPSANAALESTQLRPDAFAETFVQSPIDNVRFVEDADLRSAAPGRYNLLEGRWPSAPREVAVTRAVVAKLGDASSFAVLSGRARLRVVGVLADAYALRADTIVAASGTWESLPVPPPSRQYQVVEAEIRIAYSPPVRLADVQRVVQNVLPVPPAQARERASLMRGNVEQRRELLKQQPPVFGASDPLVSWSPLALLALLAAAFCVGAGAGAQRADTDRLVILGVPRRTAATASAVSQALAASSGAIVGLALGWLAAEGLRATVLPRFADQVLSPSVGVPPPLLAFGVVAVVVAGVGSFWVAWRRRRGTTGWLAGFAGVDVVLLRRVGAALLAGAAVTTGGGGASSLPAWLTVAAVVLVAPEVLRLALWACERGGLRAQLAARSLRADRARAGVAVVVVASCVAVPTAVSAQLASKQINDATFRFGRIPPAQVWVETPLGAPSVAAVGDVVGGVPGIGQPVVVRQLTSPRAGGRGFPAAFFTEVADGAGVSSNATLVARSAADVARVLGGLPASASRTLEGGGVLDFTGAEGPQRLAVIAASGRRLGVTPRLPTASLRPSPQVRSNFGGAILLSSARTLELPVSAPRRYIFVGTPPETIRAAVDAAIGAGFDAELVQYAVAPPPVTLPAYLYVMLAGLSAGGLGVLLLVLHHQAVRARGDCARLVAIGTTQRWSLSLVTMQSALLVGVGLVVGIVAAVAGLRVDAARFAVLAVPALPLILAFAAVAGSGAVATVMAVRTVRATEHEAASLA